MLDNYWNVCRHRSENRGSKLPRCHENWKSRERQLAWIPVHAIRAFTQLSQKKNKQRDTGRELRYLHSASMKLFAGTQFSQARCNQGAAAPGYKRTLCPTSSNSFRHLSQQDSCSSGSSQILVIRFSVNAWVPAHLWRSDGVEHHASSSLGRLPPSGRPYRFSDQTSETPVRRMLPT